MHTPGLSRRTLIAGAASAVIGWNTATRAWATTSTDAVADVVPVPALDGTLTTDATTLAAFSDDFGRLTHNTPRAVLRPRSTRDIAAIIDYANKTGLTVAMNGQGGTDGEYESHSNYGQAAVPGGIAIDARSLDTIHAITPTHAVVDPGVTWAQLTNAALAQGLTPPCLTDYLHLSIGGTISVGGIGNAVQKHGLQADTVSEIEIVTGTGRTLTASATRNRGLFEAALAGAGQVGIITRATVALTKAPENARVFLLFYDDIAAYCADQERIMADGRFDGQVGEILLPRSPANPTPNARYKIEAVAHYNGTTPPDAAPLLAGLTPVPGDTQISDTTYRDYTFRVDAFAANLKSLGYWSAPKPWLSMFLPAGRAQEFARYALTKVTPTDLGAGLLLFYPFPTGKITRPLAMTPDHPTTYLFDFLTFPAPGTNPTAALRRNRDLYDAAVRLGAKRYLVGAIPNMTTTDWQRHYGARWTTLTTAKQRHDPRHTLTPGQHIL
ncbi:FAD-binding protein [Kitasatospora sp. NPDC057904]|uniref:FAD-binding protein n=1 Tax=unclassified Kitasatospora TaxID=2633591 RepID=UPI0036DDC501